MADKPEYRALFLSSVPETLDQVTAIANEHFRNPTVIYWEMGNTATKPEALEQIEATPYNVIVSYINGLILKRPHLDRARFGAVNIHPAPPEHGGAFGIWCQPVIRRDVRTHHGVTAHEMDEDIDHGPLYEVKRWEVGEDATIQSVVDRTSDECLALCARMAGRLAGAPTDPAPSRPSATRGTPRTGITRSRTCANGSRRSIRLTPLTRNECRSIIRAPSSALRTSTISISPRDLTQRCRVSLTQPPNEGSKTCRRSL